MGIREAFKWLLWDRSEPVWERVMYLVCLVLTVFAAIEGNPWGYAGIGVTVLVLLAVMFISRPHKHIDRFPGIRH